MGDAPRPNPSITPELVTWLAAAGLGVKASYRVDEVMRLVDCSRRTVYNLIYRGVLDTLGTAAGATRPTPADHARGCYLTPTRIPIHSLARLLDPPI